MPPLYGMRMSYLDNQNIEIEGLDSSTVGGELPADTNPGAVQTVFRLEAVRQGDGSVKNVIYVERRMHLGAFVNVRPINDEVEFDSEAKKWKVKKIYSQIVPGPDGPMPMSDIKRNPLEWNAFVRGTSQDDIGTPLEFLFKNDPAKVAQYKYFHITSLEALAAQSDTAISQLPMGASFDRNAARNKLETIKAAAPSVMMNNRLEEKDRQIETLSSQVSDLSAKLTALLNKELGLDEAPKKRSRSAKNEIEVSE
jgi:hypothetical protein